MTEQTLQSLLQKGLDDLSASGVPIDYRAIEDAVKREEKVRPRGLALNRTTISQILNGTYKKAPTDGTIRAIGWLAAVSDDIAFTAAGRRPPGPPFAIELPAGVDDLGPGERRVALDLLRTLIAQRQELNRYADLLATAGSGGLAWADVLAASSLDGVKVGRLPNALQGLAVKVKDSDEGKQKRS